MKVAFFTNNYLPFVGGVPIAIDNLARRLRELGHRVFIFAPEYEEDAGEDADVFRILSISHFNRTDFSLPLLITLEPQSHFAELRPDLVHVHHPFLLGATGLNLARSMNLPVVFTYHTQYEKYAHYMPFSEKMVGDVAMNVAWRFANCCDAVIAPSTDIRDTLLERGVRTEIRVIPTGVDLQKSKGASATLLRKTLGIPADAKVLLFVSRLAKEKNAAFLLDVFGRVAAARDDAHLVMVGSGDEEAALREAAAAGGNAARIHFTGTLSGKELASAFRGADLFVFASTTETQGMVVLEAMAGGLPVVAVDAPGVRDVVSEEENGFLVPEGDADAFAARVRQVLDDPALYDSLKDAARATSRALSLAKTSKRVEDLYRHVLKHRRTPREEPFLMLKEVLRYQWDKLRKEIDEILP